LSPGNKRRGLRESAPESDVTIYRRGVTNLRHGADVDVTPYVAQTAARMLERLSEVSTTIGRALEEEIPELRGDARLVDLLGASVEGNVDTVLNALRYDIAVQRVEAPTAALEYARRLAQHGVPVNALVRAYRLGQRRITELVFQELGALEMEASTRLSVIEAITDTLFEYIDWISQQVVVVYEDERERWLENQNTMRAVRVREVLADKKTVDVDAATNTIRYPLRWHHLAVVMWYPDVGAEGHELARLQRFLRDLGQAAAVAAAPLFVAADRTCAWGWLPYRTATPDALSKVRRFASKGPDAPNVAIGSVAAGVEGFRSSHREAESARAVAVVRAAPEPSVIAATDPGVSIAALVSGDIDAARRWVAEVLGDLAADNENDARLRETLRVFLRCGSSYKQAADELGMHFNTVKYRVGRAIARRGRPIATDRLDVELALLMCQWYCTAVLALDAG
jgi:DNA-binding PucR family transcriptional regulator